MQDNVTRGRGWVGAGKVSFLALFTGAIGAFAYIALAVSPPRLQLAETEVDLGETPLEEPVSRAVRLTNVGGRTLQISKVAGTCGCTAATVEKTLLKPGEATALNLRVVRNTLSPARVQIAIESNDPENPVAVMSLLLKRPWEATVTPSSLRIHGVDRALLPLTRMLYLKTRSRMDGPNVGTVAASTSSKYLDVDVQPHSDNSEFDLRVTVRADAPSGNWRETVHLTDSNRLVDLAVEIDVSVLSRYVLPVADIVFCPKDRAAGGAEMPIQLGRRDDGQLEIPEIAFDGTLAHWLSAELAASGDGPACTIVVRRQSAANGSDDRPAGYLYVHLNGGRGAEVFCIPVSACGL